MKFDTQAEEWKLYCFSISSLFSLKYLLLSYLLFLLINLKRDIKLNVFNASVIFKPLLLLSIL